MVFQDKNHADDSGYHSLVALWRILDIVVHWKIDNLEFVRQLLLREFVCGSPRDHVSDYDYHSSVFVLGLCL